jgi:hypothetical protein
MCEVVRSLPAKFKVCLPQLKPGQLHPKKIRRQIT